MAPATPRSEGACNPAEATLHCLELQPRNGGTPGCSACTMDSTHHNKQCVERFQKIFDKEDAAAAAAVARPGAEISATSGEQASTSSGDAPPVVSPEAAEATTAFIPAENETLACSAGSLPMERMGGPGIAQQTPSAASMAFVHSRMGEVVFVHPPKADHLVMLGFCWRLRRAMNGTRQASRLWADTLKFALRRAGCIVLRTMSRVFWHSVDGYMLAVWTDDISAVCVPEALQRVTSVLPENFESKELGVIGPNRCGQRCETCSCGD